jgi:hypothetical protein
MRSSAPQGGPRGHAAEQAAQSGASRQGRSCLPALEDSGVMSEGKSGGTFYTRDGHRRLVPDTSWLMGQRVEGGRYVYRDGQLVEIGA